MTVETWNRLKNQFQPLRPNWQTGALIFIDLSTLALSWTFWRSRSPLSVFAIPMLALVLLHAYLLLHEATHSAVSRNAMLNRLVGNLAGWMIGIPFLARRRSHLLHHRWAGHPKGDPANERIIQRFSVMTRKQAHRLEMIWSSWVPLLTVNDRIGLWLDPFRRIHTGSKSAHFEKEARQAYAYLALYGLLGGLLSYLDLLSGFLAWYVPAWTIQLFLEELVNLPHHAETPLLDESDPALPYFQQHRVTHSCKSLPVWSSFVLLNFNFHTAHHLFPWIPWNWLPAVHREIAKSLPDLETEQRTRNELLWSIRNRRKPLLGIMGHYFDKIPGKGLCSNLPLEEGSDLVEEHSKIIGFDEDASHFAH